MSQESLDLLRRYLLSPDAYWEEGLGWRQASKLRGMRVRAATAEQIGETEVVEWVVRGAQQRAEDRPPPVYVVNIGGSGSHWLASMLSELPGLSDAAEVYIPPPLQTEIGDLSLREQAIIVDGIHLLHAWGLSADWKSTYMSGIVNTAHRPQLINRFRLWDPDCTVIHLFRDPRDRALSVAYRKPAFRGESAPGVDDETYLRSKAKRSDTYLRRYLRSEHQADIEIRYESIRANPESELKRISDVVGIPATPDEISAAVYRHNAENIRAGRVKPKGNLDEGGRNKGWRAASSRDRRVMHHILAFPTTVLGYQNDDCLGRDVIGIPRYRPRRFLMGRPPQALLDVSRGSSWTAVEGRSVPAKSLLRLRPREGVGARALRDLVAQVKPDVVCLAGLRGLKDEDLTFLSTVKRPIGLDISGTDVTSRLRPTLESMSGLTWVNGLDTPLEEWAESRSMQWLDQLVVGERADTHSMQPRRDR